MPMVKVVRYPRGKNALTYGTRRLKVGEEFEADERRAGTYQKRQWVEPVTEESAPRRGRLPKATAKTEPEPAPEVDQRSEPTRMELLAEAERRGIELPAGYVDK